ALDTKLDRDVAIKILRTSPAFTDSKKAEAHGARDGDGRRRRPVATTSFFQGTVRVLMSSERPRVGDANALSDPTSGEWPGMRVARIGLRGPHAHHKLRDDAVSVCRPGPRQPPLRAGSHGASWGPASPREGRESFGWCAVGPRPEAGSRSGSRPAAEGRVICPRRLSARG